MAFLYFMLLFLAQVILLISRFLNVLLTGSSTLCSSDFQIAGQKLLSRYKVNLMSHDYHFLKNDMEWNISEGIHFMSSW